MSVLLREGLCRSHQGLIRPSPAPSGSRATSGFSPREVSPSVSQGDFPRASSLMWPPSVVGLNLLLHTARNNPRTRLLME